jgi:hypothetical protein
MTTLRDTGLLDQDQQVQHEHVVNPSLVRLLLHREERDRVEHQEEVYQVHFDEGHQDDHREDQVVELQEEVLVQEVYQLVERRLLAVRQQVVAPEADRHDPVVLHDESVGLDGRDQCVEKADDDQQTDVVALDPVAALRWIRFDLLEVLLVHEAEDFEELDDAEQRDNDERRELEHVLDLVLLEGEETPVREDKHKDRVADSLDEVDVFHLRGRVDVDHARHLHQTLQHWLDLLSENRQNALADLVSRSLPAPLSLSARVSSSSSSSRLGRNASS